MNPVFEVHNLTKRFGPGCPACASFAAQGGQSSAEADGPVHNHCPDCQTVYAVRGVSFAVYPGEVLGIIGESGSGKSTVLKCINFEQPATSGTATFRDGEDNLDWFSLSKAEQRWSRYHRLGIVHQNPVLGLNFKISAGGNIAERLLMVGERHYGTMRAKAAAALEHTEVPSARMDQSPATFSGGMQQRVQIAKALVTKPKLLLLDEVTTGLDVSVQARILDLILSLQHSTATAMIVVTHDLAVIRLLASRTLVMKSGVVVEQGLTDQILEDPRQPFTQQLIASALM